MDINTARKALETLVGGTFVGIDTETPVTLLGGKKNPMQGRVTKRMVGATVMCFSNTDTNAYENMVKRRLSQEGKDPADFVLSPRAWGEREVGTAFVRHKGKYYLEAIFMRAGKVEYLLDGNPIAAAAIEGLNEKRDAGEQGGLENKVTLRTFALDNVVELRANGNVWR